MERGPDDVISSITDDIKLYTINPDESLWLLAIKGDAGAGKSLFARTLLHNVIENENQILKDRNAVQEKQAKEKFP